MFPSLNDSMTRGKSFTNVKEFPMKAMDVASLALSFANSKREEESANSSPAPITMAVLDSAIIIYSILYRPFISLPWSGSHFYFTHNERRQDHCETFYPGWCAL
jgi:hypothetical protein